MSRLATVVNTYLSIGRTQPDNTTHMTVAIVPRLDRMSEAHFPRDKQDTFTGWLQSKCGGVPPKLFIRHGKNHDGQRHDRLLRVFLRPAIRKFSPDFWPISLLIYTENLEKKGKVSGENLEYPVKKTSLNLQISVACRCRTSWYMFIAFHCLPHCPFRARHEHSGDALLRGFRCKVVYAFSLSWCFPNWIWFYFGIQSINTVSDWLWWGTQETPQNR